MESFVKLKIKFNVNFDQNSATCKATVPIKSLWSRYEVLYYNLEGQIYIHGEIIEARKADSS
uniref:Uncharacterized protein n=1 Tax=Metallosphaera hakonensis JCM 8857 = DSM 7519 TaxID=1293036 RepID=A0A2U9IR39_9CREN